MKPLLATFALIALGGCSWIGRQADALGSYMPVVGERCEHWQCMGEEGRTISNANKAEREKREAEERAAEEKAAAEKAAGEPGPENFVQPRKPLLAPQGQ